MLNSPLQIWLYFGLSLVFAELILPGLISIFVGLGALTVALALYFDPQWPFFLQLITWFISSTIYIFSLRLIVMKYYLTDRIKQNINEDESIIGQHAEVIESLSDTKDGRILFGESTWSAKTNDETEIKVGERVEMISRENISWLVKRVKNEENE